MKKLPLLDDYERRLKTASQIINETNKVTDPVKYTRLTTMASCYRTFISELERFISEGANIKTILNNDQEIICVHPFERVISAGADHNCTLCGQNIIGKNKK